MLKSIFYTASSLLPVSLCKKLAPPVTLLPYHHTVSNQALPHIQYLYGYKNERQFSNDLDFLLRHFKPVTVTDIVACMERNNALPANAFLLSFDDGFREVHDVIAPILSAKGVPAVFFINPAFIDNKELFYRCKISLLIGAVQNEKNNSALLGELAAGIGSTSSVEAIGAALKNIARADSNVLDLFAQKLGLSFSDYLQTVQPFLTTGQLHTLSSSGFTIGAHSWDHPYYDALTEQEQLAQTVSSCDYIKAFNPGGPVVFSFPHTDRNIKQSFFDTVTNGADLLFGIQNQKQELNNKMLHRFNAERPQLPLSKQVNGVLLYLFLQKLFSKQNVIRKYA